MLCVAMPLPPLCGATSTRQARAAERRKRHHTAERCDERMWASHRARRVTRSASDLLSRHFIEAGCSNADLLDSCRTGDPDIDGKWVLQVLLGKVSIASIFCGRRNARRRLSCETPARGRSLAQA